MTFKVLSYNIQFGGQDRLAAIGRVIRAQQPDAVALVEASSQDNAETLAGRLDMQLAYEQSPDPKELEQMLARTGSAQPARRQVA